MNDDEEFIRMAIAASKKCKPEDDRIHPRVGAVIVRDGKPLVVTYRGELAKGEHAEFTALEGKLRDESLVDATVYTTLEPCTSRNHPKLPCVDRLIDRKVARVVIGMLDPNPGVCGKGVRRLREANVHVDLFPKAYADEVEELNRDFTRQQKRGNETPDASDDLVERNREQRLDVWYRNLNRTYWDQNFQRDSSSIFAHLVEVIGGLSLLASSKRKPGVDPASHIVKAFAWWLALCGKLGVKSVEQMLWDKFPGVCPYCQQQPHDPNICAERKAANGGPPWETLGKLGQRTERPTRVRDWQRLFSRIYPVQQTEDYGTSFARLAEELGELAEAVRVFRTEPGYFLSEAADVFAWLMHIQNLVEAKNEIPMDRRGDALEIGIVKAYPNGCKECRKQLCVCPPILPSTIGRIAHEVPFGRVSYEQNGRFMPPDRASSFFRGG
jgi:pyrimidine deaminase RibD-like protein/NTP pyrophosphatase (non-canonical NTP hydrolase)